MQIQAEKVPSMAANAKIRVRRKGQRGTELIEFTLVLLPLLAVLFVILDASWAIFAKSTLLYAARTGVRYGITLTGTQATTAGKTLTQLVKDTVQANSRGILSGTTNRAYIQVHYLAQDSSSSTGVTDVSTLSNGNAPGNLLQVSIVNFPFPALCVRIFTWATAPDKSSTALSVVSADRIEPSGDVPAIGTAP